MAHPRSLSRRAGNGAASLVSAARQLLAETSLLDFSDPVACVYRPLDYAWAAHEAWLQLAGSKPIEALFVGLNPGPFGMVQTGVPFGEVAAVRDWLGIRQPIHRPEHEHPRRPILGLGCPRSEVSGKRLWGLFAERFGTPERFFARHFVVNYCPLAFLADSGANLTPDKLPARETAPLFAACDRHLLRVIEVLEPRWVIGVGAFATGRARELVGEEDPRIGSILHPSPASPAANRGWAEAATRQLLALGVW